MIKLNVTIACDDQMLHLLVMIKVLFSFFNQVSQELTIQFFLHLLKPVSHVMTRREFMLMSLLSARQELSPKML